MVTTSLYITAIARRDIVVRTFVKKTQKTPRAEIELALRRAKDMTIEFEEPKARLLANPKVKTEYDALAAEFEIAAAELLDYGDSALTHERGYELPL